MQITEQYYSRDITGCSGLMRSNIGNPSLAATLTCPLYLLDSLCPFLSLFPPTAHIFWRTFHTSRSNKDESTVVLRHMLPMKGKDCALFWTWTIFFLTLALKEHSLVLESLSLTTASGVDCPAKKSTCLHIEPLLEHPRVTWFTFYIHILHTVLLCTITSLFKRLH